MALFVEADLIGMRTRFQRFSDSKLFSGWIRSFENDVFIVSSPSIELARGDRFFFAAVTEEANVAFVGDFVSVCEIKKSVRSSPEPDGPEIYYLFKLAGKAESKATAEEFRRRVDDVPVRISIPPKEEGQSGEDKAAILQDTSPTGAGIIGEHKFQKGEIVTIHVETAKHTVSMKAEVRYSIRMRTAEGMHKTGLKLMEFNRLEQGIWRSIGRAA